MARLRFPGRPGQRIGKNYVKYMYDDMKTSMEVGLQPHNKIEVGLKLFYELFGYSDEEEDFEGFTLEDLAQAEALVAVKLKQKQAIHRYLESSQDLSSSAASEIEKIFSSDSDTSTSSSVRQRRGMRDIIRRSYDKMLKDGLCKSNVNSDNVYSEKKCKKAKLNIKEDSQVICPTEPISNSLESVAVSNQPENNIANNNSKNEPVHSCESKYQRKRAIVRHLLEKAKHQVKSRRRRRRSLRPNVKKKFRKCFMYSSTRKYSKVQTKLALDSGNERGKNSLRHKSYSKKKPTVNLRDGTTCVGIENTNVAHSVKTVKRPLTPKSKRSLYVGRKRFILPPMSARSSRKIIPRRRYMDECDQPNTNVLDDESQFSRSSLSGSSETISAMDGGSSPDNTQMEDNRHSRSLKKKVGLLDRPLVVEGKRPWKPSLKVQMKLSEMNYEYPFGLKKNIDGSSGTGTSSGSFKDIIKPDMVSKYAEKMAQKAKEKPPKVVESVKRNVLHNVKNEPDKAENDSSDVLEDGKKPEDKLEKVAAKIEKLLKSQWEGRLKDPSEMKVKMSSNFESAVAQWKNEQQQRSSSQRRTKNILRKARLQLKKRSLNLRTRQSENAPVVDGVHLESKNENIQTFSEKGPSILPSLPSVDQIDVPSKSALCASSGSDCASSVGCAVCGFAKLHSNAEKLYDQIVCEPCNRFFESFAKMPKQYFCTKDGNCNIDGSKETVARRISSARCKACWLKSCMEKLTISSCLRDQLIKYVPRLDMPPHNPLIRDNIAFLQEPVVTFTDLARSADDRSSDIKMEDVLPESSSFLSASFSKPCSFIKSDDESSNFCMRSSGMDVSSFTKGSIEKSKPDRPMHVNPMTSVHLFSKEIPSAVHDISRSYLEISSGYSQEEFPKSAERHFDKDASSVQENIYSRTQSSQGDMPETFSPASGSSLIENTDVIAPASEEAKSRGPRIKHVCRRAAIVLGLPRATFSEPSEPKDSFNLSALPEDEKQKILETVPQDDKPKTPEAKIAPTENKSNSSNKATKQGKKKVHKDLKVKNCAHLGILKKSSLLIHKEQKRRKLLMKKSLKHLHKHSFKKSLKLGKKSELKKTLKFSYKSAVKTSMKRSPKVISKRPAKTVKFRKVRCKQCEGCLAEDCGECAYCLDKKKFGGPNLIKQACMFRRCLRPVLPASERRTSKVLQNENGDKGKPSGGHSSFGGDGPSGIGTSLTSSSSSPSSPDGSSCGSSCSSSSSSSSSGSSGSSSSSSSSGSSSSSSSSSSSDNISVPHDNALTDSCANASLMQSIVSEPVILQESECTDDNVVTNPIFEESIYNGDNFIVDTSLQDLVCDSLSSDIAQERIFMDGSVEMDSTLYSETGDTILYEDSSSIIELKNASFAPSLMYGAALEGNEDTVSYSGGSKNQNSRQSSSGYKKIQYNQDQDAYGSAGSGGQDSNGDDDEDDDDDCKKKKHYIYADYWEDYDFESPLKVALISSQHIPLPCVCYLCGSAGEEKLIFCVLCCEPYHTFCLSEDDVPQEDNLENWCCRRCQCCAVCGSKNNLLKCKKCQNTYHSECLTPHYPTKPSRKKRIWMCPKCVKCKSCGTTSPASGAGLLWNFDLLLCQSCAKLTDKGNYCPVCHKCYEENDYDSEMVQCYKCSRWVHAKCDSITDEAYEILSCLPETVVYTCIICNEEPVPLWRKAVKEYLKCGLRSILNSLMASRCARHLIKHDLSKKPFKIPNYMPSSSVLHEKHHFLENKSDYELNIKNPHKTYRTCEITSSRTQEGNSFDVSSKCPDNDVKETIADLLTNFESISLDVEKDVSACVKNMVTNCVESVCMLEKDCRLEPMEKSEDSSCDKNSSAVNRQYLETSVNSDVHQNSIKNVSERNLESSSCSIYVTSDKIKKEKQNSVDLITIRSKLEKGKYKTISSFFDEVIDAIEAGNDAEKKHYTNEAKVVFIKQIEKAFPWFKIPASKIWNGKNDFPEGMLPNAVVPPYNDHTYSQYLKRITALPATSCEEKRPLLDSRTCVLCGYCGDSKPKKCGRLLYCGQDDWIHVNCALWSAEVFQQQDGSLRNVYPAISRGRLMHCEFCNQLGATVGCCVRGCPANYHFYCARKDEAVLQEDRKVFCALHKDYVDERIVNEDDFPIKEKIFINQNTIAPKWVKKNWETPMDMDTLHIVIGSLTVNKLGRLIPLSNKQSILIPVDYECTRIFWSTKNPRIRVKYTCRITEVWPEKINSEIHGNLNTTIIHSAPENLSEEKQIFSELPSDTGIEESLTKVHKQHKELEKNNNIMDDVKSVLYYIIKKVTKRQRKNKKLLNCSAKNDIKKQLDNKEYFNLFPETSMHKNETKSVWLNGFNLKENTDFSSEEKCHSNVGINQNIECGNDSMIFDQKLYELDSKCRDEKIESDNVKFKNMYNLCKNDFLDKYKSNFKFNSLNMTSDSKKQLVSKGTDSEIFKHCFKRNEIDKLEKELKANQQVGDPNRLLNLIAHKEVAKGVWEKEAHHYEEMEFMPPKIMSLLDTVIPPCSISETVLPVYGVEVKETSGVTESSGYSSNDDSYLRHSRMPSLMQDTFNKANKAVGNVSAKQSSVLKNLEDCEKPYLSTWKKDTKFNGQKDICNEFHTEAVKNSLKSNDSEREVAAYGNPKLENSCSGYQNINGVSQMMGPFKCNKCRRLYRTRESFKKHSDTCNFVIDSSDSESSTSSEEEFENSASRKFSSGAHETSKYPNMPPNECSDDTSKEDRNCITDSLLQFTSSAETLNKVSQQSHKGPGLENLSEQTLMIPQSTILTNQGSIVPSSSHYPSTSLKANSNAHFNNNVSVLPNMPIYENTLKHKSVIPPTVEISPKPHIENDRVTLPVQQFFNSSEKITPNVPVNLNNIPLAAENVSSAFNVAYGNALCNNSTGNIMQLPCNTLIIPPAPDPLPQPGPMINHIPIPQNFLSAIDVTNNAHLSYVGSITITNNETMSLAVNVPEQIVPVFPNQNINFGQPTVIQSPIQMQPATGIHLSTVNVQQISVQSSFPGSPFMFPQQAMNIQQNQMMFVEEAFMQPISTAQPAPNYIVQVPVGQPQPFTSYVPAHQLQQPYMNQFAFDSTVQTAPHQTCVPIENPSQIQVENHLQPLNIIKTQTESNSLLNSENKSCTQLLENMPPEQAQTLLNAKSNKPNTTPISSCRSTPTLSDRSSPVSDHSSCSKSSIASISVPHNTNIVDILKKAAEQMLNISAEMAKRKARATEDNTSDGAPEKKTRFAHTRKVAAKKAEKWKKKNAVLNGKTSKPKSVHLNIATLKPAFAIPLVPVVYNKDTSNSGADDEGKAQILPSTDDEAFNAISQNTNDVVDSDIYSYNEGSDEEDSVLFKIHMRELEKEQNANEFPEDKPYLLYEISSEDGFTVKSSDLREAWKKVYEEIQDARIASHMKQITVAPEDINGFHMMGLDNSALMYLLEQLPGAKYCTDYDFLFHRPAKEVEEIPLNASGCARSEPFTTRREYDMFNFLASEHRNRPLFLPPDEEEEGAQKSTRRATTMDLPIAMRFRNLKTVARETVGVYRSSIHGRGLFCKRNIDPGELVIEYAGEVIRSVLTDKRERIYQSKGIGCYMFRIDDDEVVDATMHGNAARFINHSCESSPVMVGLCLERVLFKRPKAHR
ncbi:LOW QUALITY PROTEIN: histone-lysine N-methyltransferase trithorax-like [Stegodyphus dumicola]|uniref:LOW QUALITY PROTEIN: histone-lysine N-methyltransferase trithorax-like n=1 Tax=Stegodyphus dumicola TaxID=202533 RepID=UPI0015AB520F|nr:LOW QUALITY PROTEIN: histone-lysine N-methyltransferase trithorax-like [Stegodyphus dumicola]